MQDLDNLQNDILSSSSPSAQNAIKKEDGEANGHAGGTADAIMLDGQVVKLNDVIAMKKEIHDLELVNESRDKRIAEVCTCSGTRILIENSVLELRLCACADVSIFLLNTHPLPRIYIHTCAIKYTYKPTQMDEN